MNDVHTGAIVNSDVTKTVERINKSMKRAVESITQVGLELIAAKKKFNHGDLNELYKLLPFSERTAQRYMAIAKSPRLAVTVDMAELPNSVSALYEIVKMPQPEYTEARQAGIINSSTTAEVIKIFNKRNDDAPEKFKLNSKAITIYVDTNEGTGLSSLDKIREALASFTDVRIEEHDAEGVFNRKQQAEMNKGLSDERKAAVQIAQRLMKQERLKAKTNNLSFKNHMNRSYGLSSGEWNKYNPLEKCYLLGCPDALDGLPLAKNSYSNIFTSNSADEYYHS